MASFDEAQRGFDVLYESLCDIENRVVDSTLKVAGFLLLATGWIATSKDACGFLLSVPHARPVATASLVAAFALYVCASIQAWWISRQTLKQLKLLNFMPPEYYQERRARISVVLVFVLGNCCLAALMIFLLWSLH